MESAKLKIFRLKVDEHRPQPPAFHEVGQLQSPYGLPPLPHLSNLLGLAIADPKIDLEKGGEMCYS